jgi:predicted phage terminase large subunit-like protein
LLKAGRDGGDDWTVVTFPAQAEGDLHARDPRQPGEYLWPNKYAPEQYAIIRTTLGEFDWTALYQQRPIPASGGLFKRSKFNIVSGWPKDAQGRYMDMIRLVRYWDLALSSKTSADYTAGVLMGLTRFGRLVILDVQRFQIEWDNVPNRIRDVALADGPTVHIGVEQAFFMARAVQQLATMPVLRQYVIKGARVDTDKFTRTLPFAARVGADLVDVVNASWTDSYLDELCAFPMGAHDDQVDASSGAYTMLDTKVITGEVRNY